MSTSKRARARGHLERLSHAAAEAADMLTDDVAQYARWAVETLENGGRLLFCGNGGSAAAAEHIATEYVVRFFRERAPLPAIALSSPTAMITAAANDFGFEQVFVRPLRAWARPGDLLVIHSTSGASANLLAAAETAAGIPIRTVALVGREGGPLATVVDLAIRIPADHPATIQELQLAIEHAVADIVDAAMAFETGGA